MSEFYNIKLKIIKEMKSYFSQDWDSDKEIHSISIPHDKLDLLQLLSYIQKGPKAYFKSKDKTIEALGLGHSSSSGNIEEAQSIESLRSKNPKLAFFSLNQFYNDDHYANEWSSFRPSLYYCPRLLFLNFPINSDNEIQQSEVRVYITKKELSSPTLQMSILLELETQLTFTLQAIHRNTLLNKQEIPSKDEWTKSINLATKEMKEGKYQKIVMARKSILSYKNRINSVQLLQKLEKDSLSSYLFLYAPNSDQAFISISPETLYKRGGNQILVDSLAGTIKRGASQFEDKGLEESLLKDQKEKEEHQHVKDEIHQSLAPLCDFVTYDENPKIMKLKYIQHLYTPIKGQLKKKTSSYQVLNALHPTPAVGGRPWSDVRSILKKREMFKRGLYAAPIGFLWDDKEDFLVGIRSALIDKSSLHIFAGAGIVKDSIADNEWSEINKKMMHFISQTSKEEVPKTQESIDLFYDDKTSF